MLGTVIEQNGDGLLDDSMMPIGWPLHIDGAVKQPCAHRDATLQQMDDLLGQYEMKRDLVELNCQAAQWTHKALWNRWYMEPRAGFELSQMWAESVTDITRRVTKSYEATGHDLLRAASAVANLPPATMTSGAS